MAWAVGFYYGRVEGWTGYAHLCFTGRTPYRRGDRRRRPLEGRWESLRRVVAERLAA